MREEKTLSPAEDRPTVQAVSPLPPVERVRPGLWSIPVPLPNNSLRYVFVYAFETDIGPFIVDFYCPRHGLVVEVDGPIHAAQVDRDQERQALLEACGYRVLRIQAADVEADLPAVLRQITEFVVTSPLYP